MGIVDETYGESEGSVLQGSDSKPSCSSWSDKRNPRSELRRKPTVSNKKSTCIQSKRRRKNLSDNKTDVAGSSSEVGSNGASSRIQIIREYHAEKCLASFKLNEFIRYMESEMEEGFEPVNWMSNVNLKLAEEKRFESCDESLLGDVLKGLREGKDMANFKERIEEYERTKKYQSLQGSLNMVNTTQQGRNLNTDNLKKINPHVSLVDIQKYSDYSMIDKNNIDRKNKRNLECFDGDDGSLMELIKPVNICIQNSNFRDGMTAVNCITSTLELKNSIEKLERDEVREIARKKYSKEKYLKIYKKWRKFLEERSEKGGNTEKLSKNEWEEVKLIASRYLRELLEEAHKASTRYMNEVSAYVEEENALCQQIEEHLSKEEAARHSHP